MPGTVHPGETLSAMLGERRITQFRLAQAIGVPGSGVRPYVLLRLGRARARRRCWSGSGACRTSRSLPSWA